MKTYRVQQIFQKDNNTFTIQWTDGQGIDYRLSDLQAQCPCAGCRDENSGKQKVDPASIDRNVRAKSVSSVGRYALRILFSSGCSMGIYSFDMLRNDA